MATHRNSVSSSGMSVDQKGAKLYSYITDGEDDKFTVMFDSVSQEDQTNLLYVWRDKDSQNTLLHNACIKNRIPIVEMILKLGSTLDEDNFKGKLLNAKNGARQSAFVAACKANSAMEIVELLLQAGSDVHEGNMFSHAISTNDAPLMKTLVKHGYDYVKQINNHGRNFSPFYMACWYNRMQAIKCVFEIEQEIAAKDASAVPDDRPFIIDLYCDVDFWLNNAWHCAMWDPNYDLMEFLLKDVKILMPTLKDDKTTDEFRKKINDKFNINLANRSGYTPFRAAAEFQNAEIMELLYGAYENGWCNEKVDINKADYGGSTPLCASVNFNHIDGIKMLLATGECDVNKAKTDGKTPLMIAAEKGFTAAISLLCETDDIKIDEVKAKDGSDIFDISVQAGEANSFALLIDILLKKNKMHTWDDLVKCDIVNLKKIDKWLEDIKSSDKATIKMEFLLKQLKEMVFENENNNSDNKFLLFKLVIGSYAGDEDNASQKVQSKLRNYENLDVLCNNLINMCDKNGLDEFVSCVNTMIKNKQPVNDTLLLLSLKYNETNFKSALYDTLGQCLDIDHKNEKYIAWFKTFILKSDVLCHSIKDLSPNNGSNISYISSINTDYKNDNDNSGDSSNDNNILFDDIELNLVNKNLVAQKEYIKAEIEKLANDEYWDDLIDYGSFRNGQRQHLLSQMQFCHSSGTHLLKDHRVECDQKKGDLTNDYKSGFNGAQQYSEHNYLNKLLIEAAKMNPKFIKDCKKIFDPKTFGINCVFKGAPIKTKERCIVKSEVDYGARQWPQTQFLLDILRCSVFFETPKDLYNGAKKFVSIIGLDATKAPGNDTCVGMIVRMKNGFAESKHWNKLDDYNYCDLKFNVIVEVNKVRVIAEIQFILTFMEKAKEKGHIFYSFSRNHDMYHDIANLYNEHQHVKKDAILEELKMIIVNNNYELLSNVILYNKMHCVDLFKDDQIVKELIDLCELNNWKKGKSLISKASLNAMGHL